MIEFDIQPTLTIGNFKDEIQRKTGIHASNQQLFFSNELLEDHSTLSDYNIRQKSIIEFKLLAPTIEKVVQAIATLNEFVDSDVKTSSGKVTEAMVILKAFVDSQSCCASTIVDLLKIKDDSSAKYSNIKAFCEKLICEKFKLTNAMKERSKEIEEIKADLKNMIIVNEMLLTEHKTLLREKDDLKTEVENVKTVNKTLSTEVENVRTVNKTLSTEVENVKTVNKTLSTEMENLKTVNRSLVEKVDKMEKQIEQLLSAAIGKTKIQ